MNIAYLLVPLIVSAALWASVSLIQSNLTGQVVSSVSDLENESTVDETTGSIALCPASCDDGNPCSIDWCNETSNYACSHLPINGTSNECWGSPTACITNTCISGKCTNILLTNCCGNDICESSESCNSCSSDCGECPLLILPASSEQSSQPTTPPQSNTTTTQTATNQTNTTTNHTTLNHIIINELTTRGPNGSYDEFAELYNPTNGDVDITGWKLQYKSATGDTWQSKVGSGLTGTIKSKSFFLLSSKGYSLTTTSDYLHSANWGLADTGGHLRIIGANGTVVDKVGWGDANEPEGIATPALEDGKSLERKSLTTDTDNNSNDFILSSPSPRNSANQ